MLSWGWITVLTWALIAYSIVRNAMTWHRLKKHDERLFAIMRSSNEMLDRYLAVCAKVGEAPVRRSERDPDYWSIDVEPDLLAVVQSIAMSVKAAGGTIVKVEGEG